MHRRTRTLSIALIVALGLWACDRDEKPTAPPPAPAGALHDDDEGPAPSGKALAGLAAPAAPTNLRVEAVTDSSGTVRWDAVEGATDYDVNYRPAQGGQWTNWPHQGTGLFNTITGLTPNTGYRWAVRAENSDGYSAWVFGRFRTLAPETSGEEPDDDHSNYDDHDNFWHNGTVLPLGSWLAGQIETQGDIDWFQVRVGESGRLTVYTTGSLDTKGTIYEGINHPDPDISSKYDDPKASNDDGGSGNNFHIEHRAQAGIYYIKVESFRSITGSYTIHADIAPIGPPTNSDFDIELVFLSSFSERDERVIQAAAWLWESIIREDLPDQTFTDGFFFQDEYLAHAIEIPAGEQIDDLRIFVFNSDDDSSYDDRPDGRPPPAGWARSFNFRETSGLPVVGGMTFNVNDNFDVSLATALHEIGHVLGIGMGLMDYRGFIQETEEGKWDPVAKKWVVVQPAGDVHFNGPLAIAAFDDAGGHNYTGKKVPMEEDWAHWRRSAVAAELMSSYSSTISAITIQALADLGYGVDVSQADPYTLPSAEEVAAKVVAAGAPPERRCGVGARRAEPIDVVDAHGRVVRTLHR